MSEENNFKQLRVCGNESYGQSSGILRRFFFIALAFFLTFPVKAAGGCRGALEQVNSCSVLLVHSYHPGLEWAQILTENLTASMANDTRIRVDIEFLDAKRHPALEHAESFLHILREKYGARLPDVLVISDDPAFDLIWPIRNELMPGVPIVFMGLNSIRDELTTGVSGVTGIFEHHTTEETVALALELTGATGIVVLNDTSETGTANEIKLKELVDSHSDVNWVIERDLSVDDIGRLDALPDDWPIIAMLPLREGSLESSMLSQRRSVEFLRQLLPNPLFYDSEWMMGTGLVGGYSLSGSDHATQAGELVLEILAGTAPENLPVRYATKHQWIFDQRELDRFGWSRNRLPPGAVYQFVTEGFWARHKEAIYPMLGILFAAGLAIISLSVMLRRQRKAEAELRAQKQRLSAALAATHAGVFEIRPDRRYASPRWLELIALEPSGLPYDLTVDWLKNATKNSRAVFKQALHKLAGESSRERVELRINDVRPRILDVLMISNPDSSSGDRAIVGVATDITATRQLEDEATRRNRLELLGELAGGIAHDFNNFLLVVKFSTEMAKELDDPNEMRKLVVEIEEAGLRATDIVKQLLAFGRHESQSGKVNDLNEGIQEILPFLQRMLGMKGDVVATLYDEPLGVRVDRPQLERVLSNLVVNARDAMLSSGSIYLDVGTETVNFTEYAKITIRDEGEGMDEATLSRIFEPFYSTKAADEGTGLGLSTVFGIVNSCGGKITVESTLGVGTTFKLFFPRLRVVGETIANDLTQFEGPGEKRILLVEDDPRLGPMTQKILEKCGFTVTLAKDGQEGLQVVSEGPENLDLILSDVVLPKLNGIEMVAAIRRLKPSIHVGFLSSFTDHPSLDGRRLPKDVELLKKPFTQEELLLFVERQFGDVKVEEKECAPLT